MDNTPPQFSKYKELMELRRRSPRLSIEEFVQQFIDIENKYGCLLSQEVQDAIIELRSKNKYGYGIQVKDL